mmetsp:Transcript_12639/g.34849  ORF Transcript_12639/g.34849 Transcript_12639/m.34849 type:complete len:102 (-) Transcript_12639:1598-1903(-)
MRRKAQRQTRGKNHKMAQCRGEDGCVRGAGFVKRFVSIAISMNAKCTFTINWVRVEHDTKAWLRYINDRRQVLDPFFLSFSTQHAWPQRILAICRASRSSF